MKTWEEDVKDGGVELEAFGIRRWSSHNALVGYNLRKPPIAV